MPEIVVEHTGDRLTALAAAALTEVLSDGAFAVDATVGNGYDTLFLAHRVGMRGRVLGFDVQKGALNGATQILQFAGTLDRVKLLLENHADVGRHLGREQTIQGAMFNLGYLPRGNRQIITRPENTLPALQAILGHLHPGGRVSVLSYRGHAGGPEEYQAVKKMVAELDAASFIVREICGRSEAEDAPRLFLLERRPKLETI